MSALWLLVRLIVLGRRSGMRARVRRRVGLGWLDRCPEAKGAAPKAAEPAPSAAAPRPDLAAPAGYEGVLASGALAEGGLVEVFAGGRAVALARVDGTVYGTSGACPHAGGPIGDGTLSGHTVTCPYHGWSFDVRDGRCFVNEEVTLPTIDVVERDGVIGVARTR